MGGYMITLTRKQPKKPIKKGLEELVAEQQQIIEEQKAIVDEQGRNIQDLQLAIDDLLLMALNLMEDK